MASVWFLDTNVLLDYLAQRPGFEQAAAGVMEAGRAERVRLCTSGLAFQTLYYLLRREGRLHQTTIEDLRRLNRVVAVYSLEESTVQAALSSDFPDFEDALHYFVACADAAVTAIVTRDPKGFRLGALPVLSPSVALQQLA